MVYPRAELSLRVPVVFMGGVIGYNGETIRRLQLESGAQIKVHPKESSQVVSTYQKSLVELRQIVISREVEAGVNALFDCCEQEFSSATKGQLARLERGSFFVFKVDVASNQVGAVIGRQGKSADSLREVSGCLVKIQGEGEVQLVGTLAQVRAGILCVWNNIKEIPSLYNLMRVSESFYKSPLAGPEVSVVLKLPDDTVGMLIGRRGETISSIRRECTGVKIDIESLIKRPSSLESQDLTLEGMREVVLRGTMRACCRAHQMITAIIENDLRRKTKKSMSQQNTLEHNQIQNSPGPGPIMQPGHDNLAIRNEEPRLRRKDSRYQHPETQTLNRAISSSEGYNGVSKPRESEDSGKTVRNPRTGLMSGAENNTSAGTQMENINSLHISEPGPSNQAQQMQPQMIPVEKPVKERDSDPCPTFPTLSMLSKSISSESRTKCHDFPESQAPQRGG